MTTSVGSNENIRLSRHIEKANKPLQPILRCGTADFLVRTRKRARYDLHELSGEEKRVLAQLDCPFPSCVLGEIDGASGRQMAALRGVQLLPMKKGHVGREIPDQEARDSRCFGW